MDQNTTVKDFMATDIKTVHPTMPLLEAASIMLQGGFTGVPVLDSQRKVVGILTEYDLLTKGSSIHLPTFLKLMKEFEVYKKDQSLIAGDLKKILELKVQDVMNDDPLVLHPETSLEEATRAFAEHHKVNPIPIVDQNNVLVGLLSRFDVVKFYGHTEPSHPMHQKGTPYVADRAIKEFMAGFEKNFVAVSRYRARYWFWISLGFLLFGVILATIFILRVDINWGSGF